MTRNQYVVTAVFKDQGNAYPTIMLVSEDYDEAENYDVSKYTNSSWNVYYEHFVINDKNEVIAQRQAKILYPT